MNLKVDDLIIEITRNCNLNCDHCLRGENQNINMSDEIIDNIFEKIDQFSSLTITGGEVFLNVSGINRIIHNIKKYNMDMNYFYIATNGTIFNYDILKCIYELYELSEYKDMSCVEISNSEFHDYEIENNSSDIINQYRDNQEKFRMLKIVSDRKRLDTNYLINEGKCDYGNRDIPSQVFSYGLNKEELTIMSNFYINVHGNIVTNCDYSYERQEKEKVTNILKDKQQIINDIVKYKIKVNSL